MMTKEKSPSTRVIHKVFGAMPRTYVPDYLPLGLFCTDVIQYCCIQNTICSPQISRND